MFTYYGMCKCQIPPSTVTAMISCPEGGCEGQLTILAEESVIISQNASLSSAFQAILLPDESIENQ